MITWTQQFNSITKIFLSFRNGKKISNVRINDLELERSQYILRPSKYESFTKGNFIILILYTMFHKKLSSKIELMKVLNELKKEDITKALKLKTDILSYHYLIDQDNIILGNTNFNNPYDSYKKKEISLFSVAEYYNKYPDKVKGRIMKKDVLDAQVLVQHFNIKDHN